MTAPRPRPRPAPTDQIHAAALAHAERWNLVCLNGEIICLRNGCGVVATLPSLLCAAHLAARQKGAR